MKRTICILLCLIFLACVPTPDEEAVTSKADGALDALIAGETIDAIVEGVDAEGETRSLRDRLGAPEHVTESLSGHVFGGRLDVTVDADVIVPETDRIPVFSCVLLQPTAAEKEALARALLGGAPYYNNNMSIYNRRHLLAEIQRYTDEISYIETNPDMTEEQKQWLINNVYKPEMRQFTSAYRRLEVDETMYAWTGSFSDEKFSVANRDNTLLSAGYGNLGFRTMDEADVAALVDYSGSEHLPQTEAEQAAAAVALDFLAAIHGTELVVESIRSMDDVLRSDHRPVPEPTETYFLKLIPQYGGLPVHQIWFDNGSDTAHQAAGIMTYNQGWAQEAVEVVVQKGEVISMNWYAPVRILRTENENVTLKAFPEIWELFQKQIFRSYYLDPAENGAPETVHQVTVAEIRLSVMRVQKPDSEEYYILPVWDFLYDFGDIRHGGTTMMTINAIDGSIIDRRAGY